MKTEGEIIPPRLVASGGTSIGSPNNWPILMLAPKPEIANRPWWRYPGRPDFFETDKAGSRIDWRLREIDAIARRADGMCIWVTRKMTLLEVMIYSPFMQCVRRSFNNIHLTLPQ